MGRGKFKGKPTGRRHFSTPEEMLAGTSSRPRTFRQEEAEEVEEEIESESEEESGDESEKRKGTEGVIEISNPNIVKKKNLKARDVDLEKTTELSRREREEIEKQKSHERWMKMQEQGKTESAKKTWRLELIRQQRAEAAKKREEEKAAKESKKVEARK